MKTIVSIVFSAWALWFATGASASTNILSGIVTTNVTLSGTNLVLGTVHFTNGAVVTIEPGTTMLMNTNATIIISGRLLANGTSNAPILFTRATASARWGRIILLQAAPSLLRHCVVEYSNSAGDHKNYYPTTCNPPAFRPRTNYNETIVVLAGHIDIDGCVFQNLPAAGGEGDAIAIISDHPDPTNTNLWNSASGTVRNSQFLDIGQGVHTRYASVLVEGCTFISHNGDNDDVDIYGESSPPSVVRNNLFLFAYDDFVNPTRSSAIIERNIFVGTNNTDHGVVLRDVGRPIVRNNIFYRCNTGAIAIQNGCEALIANNTIVNCNSAIKLFDHQDRINAPYCLTAASGKATLVNNIIRSSTPAFNLSGYGWGALTVNVSFSNVQGGTNNATRNASAVIVNGPGNIDVDPQFIDVALTNFQLQVTSPCIDAGTNVLLAAADFLTPVAEDFLGVPRPLDGNGNGAAQWDMGAYEVLRPASDSNGDGIPDGWTWQYGLNPTDPAIGASNPDGDAHTTFEEWIAGTNPTDSSSVFQVLAAGQGTPFSVTFRSSAERVYTLRYATELSESATSWGDVAGQVDVAGNGGMLTLVDANPTGERRFYRVSVRLP